MTSVINSRYLVSGAASVLLGVVLMLRVSQLDSGSVPGADGADGVGGAAVVPSLSCRIPDQPFAPAIKTLAHDIARRFHVAESAAVGITRAAFAAGRDRGIDPMLVLAVAAVESKFKPRAVNPVTGAKGLMQVMPQWHQDKISNVGGDPSMLLIQPNITVGAAILADYLDAEDGDVDNALGRYLGTAGGVTYTNRVQHEMKHLTRIAAAQKLIL